MCTPSKMSKILQSEELVDEYESEFSGDIFDDHNDMTTNEVSLCIIYSFLVTVRW